MKKWRKKTGISAERGRDRRGGGRRGNRVDVRLAVARHLLAQGEKQQKQKERRRRIACRATTGTRRRRRDVRNLSKGRRRPGKNRRGAETYRRVIDTLTKRQDLRGQGRPRGCAVWSAPSRWTCPRALVSVYGKSHNDGRQVHAENSASRPPNREEERGARSGGARGGWNRILASEKRGNREEKEAFEVQKEKVVKRAPLLQEIQHRSVAQKANA